jgi:PAS domain S-box-containing protein
MFLTSRPLDTQDIINYPYRLWTVEMPKPSSSQPRKPRRASPQKKKGNAATDLRAINRKLKREIAEHKLSADRLRKLSRAIEQSQMTVVITDLTGKIEYVNPKFVEITGYSVEEALGNNPRLMKSGETSPEEYRRLWEAIRAGRDWRGIFHNRKKNGELYWEEAIISPVVDADGQITHFVAVKEDITERKHAEERVQQQNQLLSALNQIILDVLHYRELEKLLQVIVDRSTELLDAPYSEIMLLEGNELVVRAFTANQPFLAGDRVTEQESILSWQAVKTRQPARLDDYAIWPQRRQIYSDQRLHAVADFPILSGERCLGVLGMGRDRAGYVFDQRQLQAGSLLAQLAALAIDNAELFTAMQHELEQRKQVVQTLLKREEHLSLATMASGQGVWDWNIVRDEAYLSPRYYELTGYTEGEIHPDSAFFGSLIHPDDYPTVAKSMADHLQGQSEYSIIEYRMRRKSGEYRWLHGVGKVVERDAQGAPIRMAGVIEDITERKQAEQALLEGNERLRVILDTTVSGIITINEQGIIENFNRVARSMFGYAEDEVIGQSINLLMPEPYRAKHAGYIANYLHTGLKKIIGFRREVTGLRKDGTTFPMSLAVSEVLLGNLRWFTGIALDITERKQAEEALRQHALELDARNTELDTFSHTVAHDLKSPISVVIGFSETLLTDSGSLLESTVQESLQSILRSGRKMDRIIEELMLLTGVRQQQIAPAPIDVGSTLDEALGNLSSMIHQTGAQIAIRDRSSWPIALGHASWIEEVWMNYLSNAMKYGGQPPHIELGVDLQADGQVRCWVRDNGAGLTPDERDRLFVPFTRLDQVRAKGHGLGLSIVKRIIEKLGGTVGVESEIGQGSIFHFTLPIAPQAD